MLRDLGLQSIRPLPIRPSNQLAPFKYGTTSYPVLPAKFRRLGPYLLVPGTQLNKQQLTTVKVSVRQSWKASGATLNLGRVGRAS